MAQQHGEILRLGARVFAVDIDTPEQHAAMIDKLRLPFPMLSDPDRSAVIEPWDLANPTDKRNLALPAVMLVTPAGNEAFRWVSREFAFRIPEVEILEVLTALELPPTSQDPPQLGPLAPGRHAMPVRAMEPYFRGARFAAVALATRNPDIQGDVDFFTDQMDRYREAVKELKARLRAEEEAAGE